jgi:DNA-binding Lrp family transcriptional regulator
MIAILRIEWPLQTLLAASPSLSSYSIGNSTIYRVYFIILPSKKDKTTMDPQDEALLASLRENARKPVAELARSLGLSRTTVQSRLARLERIGIIAGYGVKFNEAYEAGRIHAFIMLTIEPKQASAVTAALKKLPDVRRLQSVSGPFDMIATVEAKTVADMDATIDLIGAVKGVERTNSSIVLSNKFER